LFSLHFVTEMTGWRVRDNRLERTTAGGKSWADVTPPGVTIDRPELVWTGDESHARVASRTADGAGSIVFATQDGGQTWAKVEVATPGDESQWSLYFLDQRNGWLVTRVPTSTAFSRGRLFRTTDGGATWNRATIPIADSLRFISPDRGWIAGGPSGKELFVTDDGGDTWQPQAVTPPPDVPPLYVVGLPSFIGGQMGVLPVQFTGTTGATIFDLYTSTDGGHTWTSTAPVSVALPVGEMFLENTVDVIDRSHWAVVAGSILYMTGDSGANWQTLSPNLQSLDPLGQASAERAFLRLDDIDFLTPSRGYAVLGSQHCQGTKEALDLRCRTGATVVETRDGGATWATV